MIEDFNKTDQNFDEFVEWADILDATKTNPTLKELADQLRVLYYASEEMKNKTKKPLDGLVFDG